MDDSRLEPEAQVLLEPDMEVGLSLGREDVVEHAHLGLVVGARLNLLRAALAQLAVGRVAVALRRELRLDPIASSSPVTGRRAARARSGAAVLATLGHNGASRVGLAEPGGEDRVRDEAQDPGVDLADDGAAGDLQLAAGRGTRRRGVGHVGSSQASTIESGP